MKQNSEIDWNTDVNLIRPTIWYCQKEYIEKSLGTKLYDDLIAKVIAGTLAGSDLKLVNEYLADALLKWVMYEVQIPLLYKFRQKSTSKNTDPNAQAIDLADLRYLRDAYKNKGAYFTQRMETYLCANHETFPLWVQCSEEGVDARSTSSPTSLYLPSADPVDNRECKKYFY
ncbi:MAG: hypothetical protein ACRCYO_13385 [Bacteroidia bacterium]